GRLAMHPHADACRSSHPGTAAMTARMPGRWAEQQQCPVTAASGRNAMCPLFRSTNVQRKLRYGRDRGRTRLVRGAGARSPRVAGAVEVDQDRVQRTGRTDEQVVALGAAESEVGHDLRNMELSDQRAVGVEAVQPVRSRRPDPAACVETDAVEGASSAGYEELTAVDRGGAGHAEDPDVLASAV